MKHDRSLNTFIVAALALIGVVLAAVLSGCSRDTETGESRDTGTLTETRGEHDRDRGEGGDETGGETGEGSESGHEESGTALALDETYDVVRNGARLILAYDAQSNSFSGTLGNTTGTTLRRARVEVHLSNGIELGPTNPVDLAPGESVRVTLQATSQAFDGWTPHAEIGGPGEGDGEHSGESGQGSGENDDGEHRSSDEPGEGAGEHGSDGESGH